MLIHDQTFKRNGAIYAIETKRRKSYIAARYIYLDSSDEDDDGCSSDAQRTSSTVREVGKLD